MKENMFAADRKQNLRIRIRKTVNLIFFYTIALLAVSSTIPLLLIFWDIAVKGIASINLSFFTELPNPVGAPGGGIKNALIGTVLLVVTASILALPVGIATGIYLAETGKGEIVKWVRLCMEVLQGTPSIVIGIIAYTWFVRPMGGFSALSGSIALAIMLLPVVVRTTEETLKLVPKSLKEASLALGAPYHLTILRVILPAGLSGIVTGILISVARIAGETAPLLFTAFGNPYVNVNLLKPVSSLPHIIFRYAISPYEDWHQLAWGASLVLIVMVLSLNLLSKLISYMFDPVRKK